MIPLIPSRALPNVTQINLEKTGTLAENSPVRAFICERRDFAALKNVAAPNFVAPSADDIKALEANGNRCSDWSKVLFAPGAALGRIRSTEFGGNCLIANPAEVAGGSLPGKVLGDCILGRIENSRVCESYIGPGATIIDCSLAERAVVGAGAALFRCGLISGSREPHRFGLERDIVFAPGTGGRQLPVFPEVSFGILAELARLVSHAESLRLYREICAAYHQDCTTEFSFIGDGALLSCVDRVDRAWIGAGSHLESVGQVRESMLAGTCERPITARQVPQIVLTTAAEDCDFQNGASLEKTHFCEASFARENARCYSSVVAPNSGALGGELKYSFLGPFVGFNHQALCIATFWPGGKGNVSYGANVGSNHTGKAADQENWAGEGVFFGLGSNIKFPCNTIEAPHSIFATGVLTLPQRISLPFSLINTPSVQHPRLSPAFNEIFPGWMILNNLYGLIRNELKYAKRNRAQNEYIETRVFRPSLAPLVVMSARMLEMAGNKPPQFTLENGEAIYTDKQIPQIGKNYLTESNRKKGIEAYEFAREIIAAFDEVADPDQRAMTDDRIAEIRQLFDRIVKVAKDNKDRDRRRGVKTIPDYESVHDDDNDDLYDGILARLKPLG